MIRAKNITNKYGVIIKTPEQIEGVRKSAKLAAQTLHYLGTQLKPGMTTSEIDEMCMEYTCDHGATPAPLNYKGFPKSLCVSVNEVVCHGIPGDYVIQDGDIVNLDVTPILDGYYGDTNFTFLVGEVSKKKQKLVETAKNALYKGIEQVYPGSRLTNIGYKIQKYVEKRGFSVVRDYTGHGVGVEFHEAPTVLHYGRPNRGMKLEPGMIFTIEPMVNEGTWEVVLDKKDGWTVYTGDRKCSAQFEHTLLVTPTGVEILTDHEALWGKA